MELLANLGEAFVLGLLTPLGAVCVLPLYPGFLVYLSTQITGREAGKWSILFFGLTINAGVIIFMLALGLIFTTLLEVSLTNIIGIVSPIAFGILFIISLLLILNVDISRFIPKGKTRLTGNPWVNAFLYGFFFGAIVVPCNPGFIAILFARSFLTMDFLENLLRFLFFGIGIGAPLLVIAAISSTATDTVIGFLSKRQRIINLVAGIIMLGISLYYLIFVFRIFSVFFG